MPNFNENCNFQLITLLTNINNLRNCANVHEIVDVINAWIKKCKP